MGGIEAMRKQLEESLEAKDLELAEQGRRHAEEILELKRVIEEMGAEMEAVKGDRDKEKERETEDLKEKLSAAERSIHTLSSEIDEENDTMDGLQEEIDKLGKQLEDTRGHNEAGIEAMRKQLEESLEAKDLELAEQGRRYAEEILELKRVIEEMGAEMEAVKGDLRHTRTLLSEAEETVKGDRDKEKERETEDLL